MFKEQSKKSDRSCDFLTIILPQVGACQCGGIKHLSSLLCFRMVRNYKKKEEGGRRSFEKSQEMIHAYNAVMKKEMSLNQASKYYGVNKKSLLRRVNGEIPVDAHAGRGTTLSSLFEEELAECLKLLASWGWGFSTEELKNVVQEFIESVKLETPFVGGRPGKDWIQGFLKRHPDIVWRKTEHLSNARARAEDPQVLAAWFDLLEKVLDENGIKDHSAHIFNVDETGFTTDPKPQKVLAEKGAKRVTQSIGGSGREQITVNCAVSASGKTLPPFVIYSGKNLYIAWTEGGPEGACYTTSEKGWMEAPLFLEWFKNIFLKHTADVRDKTRLLVFDGHVSHLSKELIETAKQNNVVLLRLPAHLTHILQPLDRAVFRPVKAVWQSHLIKHARTHAGPVGKKDFPRTLKKLFEESFTPDVVKSGFASTGLCPFNRQRVTVPERPQVALNTASAPLPHATASSEPSTSTSDTPVTILQSTPSTSTAQPSPVRLTPSTSTTAQPSPASDSQQPPSTSQQSASTSSGTSTPTSEGSSLKDFFMKQFEQSFRIQNSGRSARIQRFRYGECLTSEESAQRAREAVAAKGKGKGKGKGKSKGKGKRPASPSSRSRSRSPLAENQETEEQCGRCGQSEGINWVQCDICDTWYHIACVNTVSSLEDLETQEWLCDFCTQ